MAPSVTNSDATSITSIVQFNPVTQLPIKLAGSHNFSLWKTQVSMLMRRHNLYGHLDGTIPSPVHTTTTNNQTIANPDYVNWFRQDQLIQNAILASVDPTLAATIAVAATAKAAWDSLHTAYANKSQTRVFKNLPVTDYLNQVRSLCDELATAGAPVTHAELIVKILTGLGPEYREISAAIRARDTPISYEELFEKLIDHELFLKHNALPHTSTTITAAVAQKTSSQARTNATHNNNRRQNNNQQHRSQPWRNRRANQQDNNLVCQLCDHIGHSVRVCRSQSHNHFQARANFAGRQTQQPTPWIVDTGATHHVASDAQSLTNINDYNGPEEIAMGNGNTIPISYTGSEYGGAAGSRTE
ncbi:PREDICTED: uncharacterized protein LOC109228586 [Nicotiana attenuata]|uniref:uncharacterized protein LOC109228586 n=1 Tax=Nicotiana attenuata TaxID=49451 RepID=UPI000905AF1A|nr:PREDICTED: uncharacterized protein LOC109228586 [Nicotiana attenuata]